MGIVSRAHVLHARTEHLEPTAWARLVSEHLYAYGLVLGLKRGRFTPDRIGHADQEAISGLDKALTREEASPA